MTEAHVLVVDDEPMVREVLARYLAREGFGVETAEDGESALAAFDRTPPDLVLLDLMLPRIDGLELFRLMRERGPAAVIMLTAKGEETDRVVGLELGADDYVTKPFSPREVVARVRAVLRRGGVAGPAEAAAADGVTAFGDLEVDARRREVRRAGRPVGLTRKEFDLLSFMTARPGQTFDRSTLLREVWDFAWTGDTATVTVHVRRLREKIEDDPSNPRRLVTVWGVGYRFEP
ncbi:MAG TPA: response regulator transcription factor [Actinomycetota bacterium]|nr:response regulator transcription factor [Actinomycetota bacterium]